MADEIRLEPNSTYRVETSFPGPSDEVCSMCGEMTEIAIRSGDIRVCYHCADDAEPAAASE